MDGPWLDEIREIEDPRIDGEACAPSRVSSPTVGTATRSVYAQGAILDPDGSNQDGQDVDQVAAIDSPLQAQAQGAPMAMDGVKAGEAPAFTQRADSLGTSFSPVRASSPLPVNEGTATQDGAGSIETEAAAEDGQKDVYATADEALRDVTSRSERGGVVANAGALREGGAKVANGKGAGRASSNVAAISRTAIPRGAAGADEATTAGSRPARGLFTSGEASSAVGRKAPDVLALHRRVRATEEAFGSGETEIVGVPLAFDETKALAMHPIDLLDQDLENCLGADVTAPLINKKSTEITQCMVKPRDGKKRFVAICDR